VSPDRSSRKPGAPAASGALPDRRRFLGLLGAVAAAPFAAAALPALAQSPPAAPPAPPPSVPPPAAPEKPKLSADAKSLLEIAKRRFGKNLDAAQLESIASDLQEGLDSGEALRKLGLGNSDEPDILFRALPPEV
jgi:hypothetical protein